MSELTNENVDILRATAENLESIRDTFSSAMETLTGDNPIPPYAFPDTENASAVELIEMIAVQVADLKLLVDENAERVLTTLNSPMARMAIRTMSGLFK